MRANVSPDLQRRYDDAHAWLDDQTHGHPDPSVQDILTALDESLRDIGGERSSPNHRGWKEAARTVLALSRKHDLDPVDFVVAQVRNGKTGGRWLVKNGRPFTYRMLVTPKAAERHQQGRRQRISHNRNPRLHAIYAAGQQFVEAYFPDLDRSMSEADAEARAGLSDWSRSVLDDLPHLRWLLHRKAVEVLDCRLRHGPVIEAPAEDWTFPGERAQFHRMIDDIERDNPEEEPPGEDPPAWLGITI